MRGAVALVCFLVASCVWLVHGATDAGDVAALNALFNDLDSDPALMKWVENGGDPCGDLWVGITCVGTSVTGIKLPHMGLRGDLKGSVLVQFLHLTVLDLSFNNFDNDIPVRFPFTLVELDLSNNKFEGNFPDRLMGIPTLTSIKLSNNKLDGMLKPLTFTTLVNVVTLLDLSNNRFTGAIPVSIGDYMVNLKFLYLQNNKFTGPIPTSFANLVVLQVCIVSNNKLTGYIPPNFNPAIFSYQGNNITGQAPLPPPYTAPPPPRTAPPPPSTAPPHPMSRNPATPPIINPNTLPGQTTPLATTKASSGSMTGSTVAAVVVVILVVLAVAALLLWFFFVRKKPARVSEPGLDVEANHNHSGRFCVWGLPLFSAGKVGRCTIDDEKSEKMKVFGPDTTEKGTVSPRIKAQPPIKTLNIPPVLTSEPHKKVNPTAIAAPAFTVAELQSATRSFSQSALLGGHVYRADFPDGRVLAVKKLVAGSAADPSEEAFLRVVEGVARLRNAGVVGLVGYCVEHGQRLLVYEYVGRGTLHGVLHGEETSGRLSWNMRVKIALDAARALEYLHEVCSPPVVHRNFSSHNILLDDEMLPHVSDCGLEALAPSVTERQASGYSAPEYTMSGTYTPKNDVYSFGVVMLELITGRKPLDSSRPRSEQSLVRWATPQLHDIDALARMVDPALGGVYPAKSLSRLADIVALCVQPEPEFRPSMSEVVQSLVRLMQRATLSNRQMGSNSSTFQAHKANGSFLGFIKSPKRPIGPGCQNW